MSSWVEPVLTYANVKCSTIVMVGASGNDVIYHVFHCKRWIIIGAFKLIDEFDISICQLQYSDFYKNSELSVTPIRVA